MKCPKCGGNTLLSNWGSYVDPDYADFHVECEKCGYHSMGSTEPQKAKEMFENGMGMYYTNEQWLRQATTEQLAEAILQQWIHGAYHGVGEFGLTDKEIELSREDIVEWLKQPHTTKE